MAPEDLIVLVLASSLAIGVLISVIMPYVLKIQLTPEHLKSREMVLIAIIAIISLYIGAKLQ